MSVLNQASDGIYTVLIVIVRALARFGPSPRDEFLQLCGGGLPDIVDQKQLIQTQNRWAELGLFTVNDGIISFTPGWIADALSKSADEAEMYLPKIARTLVMSSENNARFWEAESSKSADLSRGLSWLLAQDIYTLETSSPGLVASLEIKQLTDPTRCIFQNETRWQGLRVWAPYLGFAREGARLAVDPTVAVRETLPEVFSGSISLPAKQFIRRLSEIIPVFDGGTYRNEVESILSRNHWQKPPEGVLSKSLSRAVQRLDFEGVIALERGADAREGLTLVGTGQRVWRQITDVRYLSSRGVAK